MKATKFIKLSRSLCKTYVNTQGMGCNKCPLYSGVTECGMSSMKPRQLVKAVKRWAKGTTQAHKCCEAGSTEPAQQPDAPVKGMQLTKSEELTLKEFVGRWLRPNTLVRLWVPNGTGHTVLAKTTPSGEDSMAILDGTVGMSWAILDGTGWQARFAGWRVMYIADILCESAPEAVNIVLDDCEGACE